MDKGKRLIGELSLRTIAPPPLSPLLNTAPVRRTRQATCSQLVLRNTFNLLLISYFN